MRANREILAGFFSSRRGQWVVAVTTLVLLEFVVFFFYFSGRLIPRGDFLTGYNTEAFAWWKDGSFFRPVQWLPYCWGGYPGTLNLQNSSWYLPVGLMASVTPFTLWASAVLSALHVAFGALGAFVLARRWRLAFAAQMFALLAWFFVEGFYSHAMHLDIMRGFAWMPWVLLVFSPQFPWRRWWGPPAATLVLWQAFLAAYPGQLLVAFYALAVWLLCIQIFLRPRLRDYLVPVLVASVLAGALSLLRFLPFALVRGLGSPGYPLSWSWSWWLPGGFFYVYGATSLLVDLPDMRSFFLPVVVFVAAGLVRWRSPLVRVVAITAISALLLGLPFEPWSSLIGHLPGLNLSRFRMDDAKLPLLMMFTLLGAGGLHALVRPGPEGTRTRLGWGRWTYWILLLGLTGAVAILGPFGDWPNRWSWLKLPMRLLPWLAMLGAVLAIVLCIRYRPRARSACAIALCSLTLLSGLFYAFGSHITWSSPRTQMEEWFSAPVSVLISQRDDPTDTLQRPARLIPETGTDYEHWWDTEWWSPRWNGVMYSGDLAVMGAVNLKGAQTWDKMFASLTDPSTEPASRAFWSAPGIGISVNTKGDLPDPSAVEQCVATGESGEGLVVTPVSYSPHTPFVYQVDATQTVSVAFNEAYYRGWTAEAADGEGATQRLSVTSGSGGELVVGVPPGRWQLTLKYAMPGLKWAWVAFGAAWAAVLGWVLLIVLRRGRAKTGCRVAPDGEAFDGKHE